MTWNHRVLRHVDGWGDAYYTFAEVFYNDEGVPDSYSNVCMVSETIEGMQEIADRLLTATAQPVLDVTVFGEAET